MVSSVRKATVASCGVRAAKDMQRSEALQAPVIREKGRREHLREYFNAMESSDGRINSHAILMAKDLIGLRAEHDDLKARPPHVLLCVIRAHGLRLQILRGGVR